MKTLQTKFKSLTAFLFLSLIQFSAFADEATDELNELKDDTLVPLLNTITGIVVLVAIVVAAVMFWLKHRESIKYVGWVAVGAVVLRVGYSVVKAIIGDGIGV